MKKILFYCLLKLRKRQSGKKKSSNGQAGYGLKSYEDLSDMERPQSLESHVQVLQLKKKVGENKSGGGGGEFYLAEIFFLVLFWEGWG